MISTDSLEARIWRKRSYKLVKSLVFGERLYSNPTIMNDKLYVPLIESGNIGVWNLVELIDNDNKINIKIAVNSLKSSLITVKDTIWCVGNKITIIDSNHNVEEIGENVTNAQFKLELIENNVWIFSDKSVEIWSPETKQLVKKFDHIMDGKIANISFLRNHVWIYGDQGTYGIICIFDPQTFELVKKNH